MEFITEDMKLAVKCGATWLDQNYPEWETRIDLSYLNMQLCQTCIIGQALGSYLATINTMCDGNYDWDVDNGFDLSSTYSKNRIDYWKGLDQLWTDEVLKRLS